MLNGAVVHTAEPYSGITLIVATPGTFMGAAASAGGAAWA
jgi:hypothetical protein